MQSIGERLEEARKRKGISIREAAEATKIRSDYLHKFESNQFDIKLPEIYIRGFLRNYANFLKVPSDKIINDYNGLGLGEAKAARIINREVYGRMDLSIGSKAEKEGNEPPAAPVQAEAAPAGADTAKNPATFVPRSTGRGPLPIDRGLLIKAGILLAITAVVVIALVMLFSGPKTSAPTNDSVWVKALAGEPVVTLIANAPVNVTVKSRADGSVLYQGTVIQGSSRAVPRRGALLVTAEPYQNLQFEIMGKRYPMPDRPAEIAAP